MEPFIGEIRMFAGNFAPTGWALCNGQLVSINSSHALFAILGTTYGGDGQSTFALPDLRGRVPLGAGVAADLPGRELGARNGAQIHGKPKVFDRDRELQVTQDSIDTYATQAVNFMIATQGIFPPRD